MGLARDWFIVGSFFHGGKVTTSNENGPAFGMENVPVRRLLRGVSGATGARKRPASGVLIVRPRRAGQVGYSEVVKPLVFPQADSLLFIRFQSR